MRPRPEGRGEPSRQRAAPVAYAGFNAATTRRPWRTSAAASTGTPRSASMRPRPEGRGERRTSCGAMDASGRLQCGHDPKAVENSVRWDDPAERRRLQCGHDPKAVENLSTHRVSWHAMACFNAATTRRPWRTARSTALAAAERDASMRPRPEGRGEPAVDRADAELADGASMRPRPEGRGERAVPSADDRAGAVASMRPRPEGRGERVPTRCHVGPTASFNAATTRRPWRTLERRRRSLKPGSELQCGHDPKAVENPRGTRPIARRLPCASMRPRPEGRGERQRR